MFTGDFSGQRIESPMRGTAISNRTSGRRGTARRMRGFPEECRDNQIIAVAPAPESTVGRSAHPCSSRADTSGRRSRRLLGIPSVEPCAACVDADRLASDIFPSSRARPFESSSAHRLHRDISCDPPERVVRVTTSLPVSPYRDRQSEKPETSKNSHLLDPNPHTDCRRVTPR